MLRHHRLSSPHIYTSVVQSRAELDLMLNMLPSHHFCYFFCWSFFQIECRLLFYTCDVPTANLHQLRDGTTPEHSLIYIPDSEVYFRDSLCLSFSLCLPINNSQSNLFSQAAKVTVAKTVKNVGMNHFFERVYQRGGCYFLTRCSKLALLWSSEMESEWREGELLARKKPRVRNETLFSDLFHSFLKLKPTRSQLRTPRLSLNTTRHTDKFNV